jgi:Transcriptional Coactivator p15 (PC4)
MFSCSQFYEDKETGQKKPGKKGVSLAADEVNTPTKSMLLVGY